MTVQLPSAAGDVAKSYPEVWEAYSALGKACSDAGPLTDRERRLVKLALAIGGRSEGAVHSHTRRASEENIEPEALRQVALLGIGPLGFPAAVAAVTWIDDVLSENT